MYIRRIDNDVLYYAVKKMMYFFYIDTAKFGYRLFHCRGWNTGLN